RKRFDLVGFGMLRGYRVSELQDIGDGGRREDGGNETGSARGEHQAERESGCDPLADAERAGDELADGLAQALALHLFVDFARSRVASVLRERRSQGTR